MDFVHFYFKKQGDATDFSGQDKPILRHWRNAMTTQSKFTTSKITKSKLALVVALAVIGIPSVASAQSSIEHFGSQLPYYYDGSGAQVHGAWAPPAQVATLKAAAPQFAATTRAHDAVVAASKQRRMVQTPSVHSTENRAVVGVRHHVAS
jgi:hypothetical protein